MFCSDEFDVEKYRKPYELEDQWKLRRDFILAHRDKFDEDELLCLAQIFVNVEMLETSYDVELMKKIRLLEKDIPGLEERRKMKSVFKEKTKTHLEKVQEKFIQDLKQLEEMQEFRRNSNYNRRGNPNDRYGNYGNNRHSYGGQTQSYDNRYSNQNNYNRYGSDSRRSWGGNNQQSGNDYRGYNSPTGHYQQAQYGVSSYSTAGWRPSQQQQQQQPMDSRSQQFGSNYQIPSYSTTSGSSYEDSSNRRSAQSFFKR